MVTTRNDNSEQRLRSHLLVNYGRDHRDLAERCKRAAASRFPGLVFSTRPPHNDWTGGWSVCVDLACLGPSSAPTGQAQFDLVQQFCAGFWYATYPGIDLDW